MKVENINNRQWEKIVSRPFSLFGASVWNEWYDSKATKDIFGVTIPSGLFVEYPKGIVRHYRDKGETTDAKKFIQTDFKRNQKKYEDLLKQGRLLNKQAKQILKKNHFQSLEQATEFLVRLALLSTILPFFLGDLLYKKYSLKKILFLATALRGASFYPRIVREVIEPLAKGELDRLGVDEPAGFKLVTYGEIISKDKISIKDKISQRNSEAGQGKNFVYQNLDGKESVVWVENPEEIVRQIESSAKSATAEIKGSIAYSGKVTGRVRLVFTDDVSNIEFQKGDILVASSTNPNLMPLLRTAGAIVTDEGGLLSHAAIVSRELGIPCVVGTKIATQVLKDGDLVEVDAEKGIVRKL